MKTRIRNFTALSLALALAIPAVCSAANKAPSRKATGVNTLATSVQSTVVAPNLGSAGLFVVLGASTVTNTGASVINGNLGLSPGISVTGFPPGILNGTLHITDPTAAQAQLDLTAAYNDAAGRTLGAIMLAGNLGGLTLVPGLYKSTSSLEISSGDLTLDAQGDANAVYIFDMASTFVSTVGRKIILAGGAQAANIYWQVGSSATLGTSSVFKGNIMALASITVTTGASVEGRLLARTAAVTLDDNAIVVGAAAQPVADITAPGIQSVTPFNGATGVAVGNNITVRFNEAMSVATINAASLRLNQGTTVINGTVSYAGGVATFNPAVALAPSTVYAVTMTSEARDVAGNPLASGYVWSFTTASVTAGMVPVSLGWANAWEVLAASTVTSTGATAVSGDLGVSPGTAVTGFPPGILFGTLHAGDAAAALAQVNLTASYNDAAGRTTGAILLAGNLGGRTLAPGLYKSTSSLEISSGDLTLDGGGNANAVFIFQMGSTLTTTVGRRVILTGGAQAANIVWQVGSSATLGVNSEFKGTILAMASITVTTGAKVEGRLLARTGAVTLDANLVVRPSSSALQSAASQPISEIPTGK
jgi:cytoskeletal protein CcmA (bactofilin family)